MPNPDSGNLKSDLANKPKQFRRPKRAPAASVVEKTANWPSLPGKGGPNRSAGIPRARIHPKSVGLG